MRILPHQFEFSVWWDEADGAVTVEFTELDALVELTVVELNERILDRSEFRRLSDSITVSSTHTISSLYDNGAAETNDLSRMSLSFNPNLHSGVPLRYARMRICPSTSARSTFPLELMLRLTVSTTSTKASFLRYLTSFLLHDVAPVAWIVIFDASSRCHNAVSHPVRREGEE